MLSRRAKFDIAVNKNESPLVNLLAVRITKNKAAIFPTNGVNTIVELDTPDETAKGEYLKL